MDQRLHPAEAYNAIKAAVRRLVGRAGGLESAASITRVSHASLGYYGDVNKPGQNMPVDIVADLEKDVGEPVVTRELARLGGYDLVPVTKAAPIAPSDPGQMMLRLMTEMGELSKSIDAMEADGRRTPNEMQTCLKELDDLIAQANACRDRLCQMKNGEG